jgi:carbon storage regulator
MLLITRRAGERIVLGDDIIVEVMEITGTQVRVGIHAPRTVPIYREEIWSAVKEENAAAADAAASADALARVRPPGA